MGYDHPHTDGMKSLSDQMAGMPTQKADEDVCRCGGQEGQGNWLK